MVNWKSALCPGGAGARPGSVASKNVDMFYNASVARRLVTVGAASGGGVPLSPAGLDTEKLWGGTILYTSAGPGAGWG